jgi:pyruvate/2-oxoglutarate dehydrogenase complex dihydrolipoamide acyltransferase (E2) component
LIVIQMLLSSRKSQLLFRSDVRLKSYLFPSVQRLVVEYNINPESVHSSGKKKRLLKGDIIKFIQEKNLSAQKKSIQWPQATGMHCIDLFLYALFSLTSAQTSSCSTRCDANRTGNRPKSYSCQEHSASIHFSKRSSGQI